jgi:hypothetical protein
MSRLILPSRFLDQPQHPVELSSEFDVPGALAYLGGQRALIGRGNYAEGGTIVHEPCRGGVGSRGTTSTSYINAGRQNYAQAGAHAIMAQFIALDTTSRPIAGENEASGGSTYIEFLMLNTNSAGAASAGRVRMQFRNETGGLLLAAATTNVVFSVGAVHTMVWSMPSATTLACAVDGQLVPLTYSHASTYNTALKSMLHDYDLLNYSNAGAHPLGTNIQLLMFARLPIGGLDIEALSAEPYQIFQAPDDVLYFDLGAGGDPTGTLAATETGADVAALAGDVYVVGALAATETGADAAAVSGTVLVIGSLSAAESGSDSAAFTGTATGAISGSLVATESGADTSDMAGVVLVSGALAAAEIGADTASLSGSVLVTGSLSATEAGADTASFTSSTTSTGALAATETGADSAALTGVVVVEGNLAAAEVGADAAAMAGDVVVGGSLAATETGSDTAAFTGDTPAEILGTVAAQEAGADSANLVGAVRVRGSAAITETGADTAIVVGPVLITGVLSAPRKRYANELTAIRSNLQTARRRPNLN